MCPSPGYSQLHAGHWLLIQRRILQESIEYRLEFDEQLIFVTKGLRICFPYLSRHMDSELPLSSFHGFSIHSKSHISQLGFTHFVRCNSKADISSHAAISNFLRGCYQISEINLDVQRLAWKIKPAFDGLLEGHACLICCNTSLAILIGCLDYF